MRQRFLGNRILIRVLLVVIGNLVGDNVHRMGQVMREEGGDGGLQKVSCVVSKIAELLGDSLDWSVQHKHSDMLRHEQTGGVINDGRRKQKVCLICKEGDFANRLSQVERDKQCASATPSVPDANRAAETILYSVLLIMSLALMT